MPKGIIGRGFESRHFHIDNQVFIKTNNFLVIGFFILKQFEILYICSWEHIEF